MGDDRGPLPRCHSGEGRAVPEAAAHQSSLSSGKRGGIVMNTATARRLALGDCVIWIGKDSYQPSGSGIISRITAHEVEVLWEGKTPRRYRRAQLQQHSTHEARFRHVGDSLRAWVIMRADSRGDDIYPVVLGLQGVVLRGNEKHGLG
jgi:hypothetical protein